MKFARVLALTALALAGTAAFASPLTINESSYGDYNDLLAPPTPTVFTLGAGANTFAGTFGTPSDQGDTLLLQLANGAKLTGISVLFGTNLTEFNPIGINQGSHLVFDSASSDQPTPMVDLLLPAPIWPDGAVNYSSGLLDIGDGLYNLTLLTGVLARYDNSKLGYVITLDVSAPEQDPNGGGTVPEPATPLLALGALAAAALARRNKSR